MFLTYFNFLWYYVISHSPITYLKWFPIFSGSFNPQFIAPLPIYFTICIDPAEAVA